jgi:CheY-like chemotaxis protein
MRVLFVDDDKSVCDLLTVFCSSLGMEFRTVNRAQEALELCEEEDFTLVVTDLQMPEMDGMALAIELRQRYPGMAIYAFTGDSRVYPMKMLRESFDKVFLKPSDYSRLIADAMKYLAIRKYPFLA